MTFSQFSDITIDHLYINNNNSKKETKRLPIFWYYKENIQIYTENACIRIPLWNVETPFSLNFFCFQDIQAYIFEYITT